MDQTYFIDPDTEAEILAACVQKNSEMLGSGLVELLEPEQFSVQAYRWLVEQVLKEGQTPPWPTLNEKIRNEMVGDEAEKVAVTLSRLYNLDVSWVADAIGSWRRFLAFQTANSSARKFYEGFNRTHDVELSLSSLETGLGAAQRILSGKTLEVVDYAANWIEREAKRKRRRDNPDLYPRLRMGISRFDAQVKMDVGTVTNFLAPAKRHKSIILTSLAYAGLLQGFNVALVVVENTIELTVNRLDSMFLQLNYDRVVEYLKTREEKEYADRVFARAQSWPQRLKIVKGDPQKTGTVEVERELKAIKQKDGFTADIKIYDYCNIMKASVRKKDDWETQTQIIWDLQAIAKARSEECIVVTASQSNMAGISTDKQGKPVDLQAHHQGRSLGIAQGVDATVAINIETGATDEATGNNQPPTIVLSPLYIRDGAITDSKIRLVSEIDRMCVDREIRKLWDEVDDGFSRPVVPGDN